MLPAGPIGDRFDVERVVAQGGMGIVYRAQDRRTGQPVALKLLSASATSDLERFQREAAALAELRHPHVVAYVAHGRTDTGVPYLAMEWIDGETLAARLARGPLDAADALTLIRLVAEALGEAHRRGLVHRDLKPSNLLLPGGVVSDVKVIDFGVVRRTWEAGPTMTGAVVGTLQYMAPEQARGSREIGPAADVFACGCVLYECLTGRPAFHSDDPFAVRAKVLLEGPPALDDLVAKRPALGEVLRAMLAKDPARRPRDGDALAKRLAEIDEGPKATVADVPRAQSPTPSRSDSALGSGERRFVFLVLAGAPRTAAATTPSPEVERLRAAAAPWATRLETFPEGALVAVLTGEEAATDLATKAARCALALRQAAPTEPVALVAGRAVLSGSAPLGEAVERGIAILRASGAEIRVDDVTAGLLDPRFEVGVVGSALLLVREREASSGVRTLLGRPTPCVGRDAERATLAAVYRQASIEPVARAALVLGPPGAGKTRLANELVAELASSPRPPDVLVGAGDPLRAGSPFGLLAPAVRRAAGIGEGEPIETRRAKLSACVAAGIEPGAAGRVARFLGELAGVPFPDDADLRAARRDPMIFVDRTREAFVEWLRARLARAPVVLVLEDIHWGDAPSIDLVGTALERLADLPLFVLALSRSDARGSAPDPWPGRDLVEIRLGPLPPRAGAKLVRAALGADVDEAVVERIVERGAGNPYYLEELCRAEAEGGGAVPPGTVLAMIQARLEALAPEARRILRAASVFGGTFRRAGVAALVESDAAADPTAWLRHLEAREVVVRRADPAGAEGDAYAFRHALVQEAAYATLTDEDRALGHRLAARWLDAAGEPDAAVLALHRERGGEVEEAIRAWSRAAEQALEGTDLASAIARGDRAIALGAEGPVRGAIRAVQAEARRWRGEHAQALDLAREAMAALTPGDPKWWGAVRDAAWSAVRLGRADVAVEIAGEASATKSGPPAARLAALVTLARHLVTLGEAERAGPLALECERQAASLDDPHSQSHVSLLRAALARAAGDPVAQVRHLRVAREAAERAGDVRNACACLGNLGRGLAFLGRLEEAEAACRESLAIATKGRLAALVGFSRLCLGIVAVHRGDLDAARDVLGPLGETFDRQGDSLFGTGARAYLACAYRRGGDFARAAREARAAVALAPRQSSYLAFARAELARALVGTGGIEEACRLVDDLATWPQAHLDEVDVSVYVARAEVLLAARRGSEAKVAARAARERLFARADRIEDPDVRRSFLERVPDHARALELTAG